MGYQFSSDSQHFWNVLRQFYKYLSHSRMLEVGLNMYRKQCSVDQGADARRIATIGWYRVTPRGVQMDAL
jgi:hypothetical protein